MKQFELLRLLVSLLNEAEIRYMVVGSFASTFYGEPRMTRDIDLVVDPSLESIALVVERLGSLEEGRFYVGDAQTAVTNRDMFNVIDNVTGWKVDLIVRKGRAFSQSELDRRVAAQLGGVDVFVSSAEDTVLAKLEWGSKSGSDRQFSDAVAVIRAQELDREYMELWATELGIGDLLHQAITAAREPTDD